MSLPQPVYEVIRWVVTIVLPAIGVFFATLAEAWGWNLPTQAILTTISALSLFLGAIFGISKLSHDAEVATPVTKPGRKN